jgi:hypothetical protein
VAALGALLEDPEALGVLVDQRQQLLVGPQRAAILPQRREGAAEQVVGLEDRLGVGLVAELRTELVERADHLLEPLLVEVDLRRPDAGRVGLHAERVPLDGLLELLDGFPGREGLVHLLGMGLLPLRARVGAQATELALRVIARRLRPSVERRQRRRAERDDRREGVVRLDLALEDQEHGRHADEDPGERRLAFGERARLQEGLERRLEVRRRLALAHVPRVEAGAEFDDHLLQRRRLRPLLRQAERRPVLLEFHAGLALGSQQVAQLKWAVGESGSLRIASLSAASSLPFPWKAYSTPSDRTT